MKKKYYIAVAIAMVAAFSVGKFLTPAKVEIREVEKIVKQESEKRNEDKRIIKVVRETIRPDGTIVKETRQEKESSTQTERDSTEQTERLKEEIRENRPDYRVGVVYHPDIDTIQTDNYSLTLERRLFSQVFMGVLVGIDKTIGVSLSFGF